MNKENYSAIDLMKFVCSLLVVILHVATYAFADMASGDAPPTGKDSPFVFVLPIAFTILRIAVPMFFIASGFFLFNKIKKDPENSWSIVKHYCKRIMKLWLFWFVISLPIMIDKYIIAPEGDLGHKCWTLLYRIVFYGGFDGSWYLLATVLSVLLIYGLTRKLKNIYVFMIAFVLYALASLSGTYFNLFDGTFIGEIFNFFNKTVPLYHTLFNGSIFILIGKLFAENKNRLNKATTIALLSILPFAMYGELLVTNYFGLNYATDCFLMLVPFSIVFFQFVLNANLKSRNAYATLRGYSTFIYLFHFIFLYVLYRFASAFNWTIFYGNIFVIIAVYILAILTSIVLYQIVKKLSKRIKVLKYSI